MATTPSSPESFPVIFMLDTVVMDARIYYEELILRNSFFRNKS